MRTGHKISWDGKILGTKVWNPHESTVEASPDKVILGRGLPEKMPVVHWHAQIEINYVPNGWVQYEMCGKQFELQSGDIALFWGGLPHRLSNYEVGSRMDTIHLPLMQFFRLRLADEIRDKLMAGAVLIAASETDEDHCAFERWGSYFRSGDMAREKIATEELLIRLERIGLDPYQLIEIGAGRNSHLEIPDQKNFDRLRHIVEFVTGHFREDLDISQIAGDARLHPKYAMTIFKRSTGVTLNHYIVLLRLAYAQALLIQKSDSIVNIAMASGFGSLSHFNQVFRKHTGLTPTEFRREMGENRPTKT
ncbi:helix-turn-helix domain-containing protein [Devosia rhodophyticola]|uniref:Helix-turn-helix domain-containing protein n=1 Tax=Devosia rhodophyticola TaxID=3026423 RepID=A0ABY7YXR2_9HYPH|nr:helix-turn-helix domain-containing protein [Devosia rhodophyticola]WDR06141.1 helix-turn-helix domain-containing protein [Devosia rhodophyticola]